MVATRTIPLRLDQETIDRLDAIADVFTLRASGLEATRSAVMRLALTKGLEFYEDSFGIGKSAKATKKKK
ncbi:MAG TPA: hypothetical protein VER11_29770 [Polyangiaceae bacterium]|nr:hypothetical protein [Polyangiaceae bacterium]